MQWLEGVTFSQEKPVQTSWGRNMLAGLKKSKEASVGLPCGWDSKRIYVQCRRPRFNPWVRKIPWRRKWQPTPVFLPGRIPWTEEPDGLLSMGSQKSRIWLSNQNFHSQGGQCGWGRESKRWDSGGNKTCLCWPQKPRQRRGPSLSQGRSSMFLKRQGSIALDHAGSCAKTTGEKEETRGNQGDWFGDHFS